MPFNDDAVAYAQARLEDIGRAVYVRHAPLDIEIHKERRHVEFERRLEYEDAPEGEYSRAWVCVKGTVPASCAGRSVAAHIIAPHGSLIYSDGGKVLRALESAGEAYINISERAAGGEEVRLWLECSADAEPVGNICIVNENMRALYCDMEVLISLAEALPARSIRRRTICRALEQAMSLLTDLSDEYALGASYALKPELNRDCGDYGLSITAIGISSMAAGRTDADACAVHAFANALDLMKRYDDFVLSIDQAQCFAWACDFDEDMKARIRERISQGRIEPMGGWVMPGECASGEMLVRSLVMGKRYYMHTLCQDINVARMCGSIPGQLPQILLGCGIQYLLCEQPHGNGMSSFWLQGTNGARVLAHAPGSARETDAALPQGIIRAAESFEEVGISDQAAIVYGGEYPSDAHMERISRMHALRDVPPVHCGRACDFFEKLRLSRVELPVRHAMPRRVYAGAYTSHIDDTVNMHRLENLIRLSEIVLCAMHLRGAEYPRDELYEAWRSLMLAQTRDGSDSIAYAIECGQKLNAKVDALFYGGLDVIINPHAWTVDMWLPADERCQSGQALRMSLPPMSATSAIRAKATALPKLRADVNALENDKLQIRFDERGCLAGVRNIKQGFDALRGASNQLNVYKDDGTPDAPDPYTLARRVGTFVQKSAYAEVDGAVCRRIAEYTFGSSTLRQTVEITAGSARIDFITEIDWHEKNRLLRAEFPVCISAGRLRYAAPFSFAETAAPLDRDAGEICTSGWLSLDQSGRGVALMSDGSCNGACAGNVLSLSIVRACRDCADEGVHTVRYAMYTHTGDISSVMRQAALFHRPPVTRPGVTFGPLCWLDSPGVMLDVIKVAEDSGDIVIRMHECTGASTATLLKTGFDLSAASICDLMERVTAPLEVTDDGIALEFAPFEIKTVVLTQAKEQEK